jgi:site-specific DNA-methyltransferase (adenine-specific)
MQYLIRLVTPKGGTILDPFNGSGSTGKAAMYENNDRNSRYKYIGIELTPEYLPISEARITYAINAKDNIPEQPISASKEKMMKNQMNLFDLP